MARGEEAASGVNPLAYILGATAVSGGIGYLIMVVMPWLVAPATYGSFTIAWSVIYLLVASLAGVQQETTRASAEGGDGTGWRTLWQYASTVAVLAGLVVAVSSLWWAPRVFPIGTVPLVLALIAAVGGYTLVAAYSGALYGLRLWPQIAGMTVIDSVARLVLIAFVVVVGSGIEALGLAIALPFGLAVAAMVVISRRRVRSALALDRPVPGLLRNSMSTVGASVSTGLLISGVPFVLGMYFPAGGDQSPAVLVTLLFLINVTRAPLVIPLLALQSYFIVTFRDHEQGLGRRLAVWVGAILGIAAIAAALSALVGPWILSLLPAGYVSLPPLVFGMIVLGAGMTGLLCVTGAAALARDRHQLNIAGWALACVVFLAILSVPGDMTIRVTSALLIGPAAGVLAHVVGALWRGRSRGASERRP